MKTNEVLVNTPKVLVNTTIVLAINTLVLVKLKGLRPFTAWLDHFEHINSSINTSVVLVKTKVVLVNTAKSSSEHQNSSSNHQSISSEQPLVLIKLEGLGPVDNRPFTNWLDNFIKKHTIWQMTNTMWHATCDTCLKVNILSKYQLPSSYGLREKVFWRYLHKGSVTDWMDYWVKKVSVK